VDNTYVFPDHPARYSSDRIAQIPKIVGTIAREAAPLVLYPLNNVTAGPSEALITSRTLGIVCAAYNTSVYRDEANIATYRHEWAGNFSNIAPIPWLGAYHYSDLYMFFGTYPTAPGVISDFEVETADKMQDLLYAFVEDPDSLPDKGWPEYQATDGNGGRLARFGADGKVLQLVDGNEVEGACHLPGYSYDTTP